MSDNASVVIFPAVFAHNKLDLLVSNIKKILEIQNQKFQKIKSVCCIYDELSAVSCLETIREGFDVKIIVCFRKESDLLNLVKIVNNLIPHMLKSKIELEFFQILINGTSAQNYLLLVEIITELILSIALLNKLKRVSLAVSPLVFPQFFIDRLSSRVYQENITPHTPLTSSD